MPDRPTSIEEYLRRLRLAVGCPEQWEDYRDDRALRRAFLHYWQIVARCHESAWDTDYYFQLEALEMRSLELLRRAEANAPYWRPRAAADYDKRMGIFKRLHMLEIPQHPKHWVIGKEDPKITIDRTNGGPAKYFASVPYGLIREAAWLCIRGNWRRMAETKPEFLYARMEREIGASSGKATDCLRIIIDYSTGAIHSHPILADEKPSEDGWLDEIGEIWPDMYDLRMTPTLDEELEYVVNEMEDLRP